MARKTSSNLTDAELRLMEVLWEKGPATVWGVLEGLAAMPRPAYSTVITTLRSLEKKGYVRHKKDGRSFTYEPLVGRHEARRSAAAHLLQRLFEGSPELLMASLFEDRKISAEEFERLRRLAEEERP